MLLHWLLYFQSCPVWLSVNSVTPKFWTIHMQILLFCLFWLPPVAPIYFPTLLHQRGCFELPVPVMSSSSLGLLWRIPLLPAPPHPALSLPFPVNQLSSLCGFISDHIFSSEFAHWVFREELHVSVLVFKSYKPSGLAEHPLK